MPATQPTKEQLTILVVDDSSTARAIHQAILEGMGYRVAVAEDGRTALNAVCDRHSRIGLILCDLVMSGMDGIELLRALRSQGIDTPFVLVTGHASVQSAIAALRQGADDYLLKPVDAHLLHHRISAVMDRRRLAAEQADRERLQGALALAGAAAHELNQPLTVILGAAEMLVMATDNARREELALRIVQESSRLAEITRRLGSIVRFQTKPYLGETQIVDLDSSIIPCAPSHGGSKT